MTEPVVFLPGMMCDARLFGPQIAALSADKVVTVAPVTTGETMEEIAAHALARLPRRFALAGLSMGGIVAMEMLRQAPDRITRIALLDTNPLPELPEVSAAREPQIAAAREGRLLDVMREEMKPKYLAPGSGRADVLRLVMDMAEALGPQVFERQSRALQRRSDQRETLRACRVPALVLCGAHDRLCPVERHVLMAELLPDSDLRVLDASGHLPTLEQPGETTLALRAWLDRAPGAA